MIPLIPIALFWCFIAAPLAALAGEQGKEDTRTRDEVFHDYSVLVWTFAIIELLYLAIGLAVSSPQ